jgi:gamma-polyglutamate biosynthesis protein CapC
MHEIALVLGILGGLLSYEFLGFSPGGIVTPGYLAIFADQPIRIVGTIAVSLCTLVVVRVLGLWMILFGRRRFAVTMLVSFILRWAWDLATMQAAIAVPDMPEMRVVGFIVPGLIANDLERQGIAGTLSVTAIVTALVRLALLFFGSIMAAL